jgi:hypothetical protein
MQITVVAVMCHTLGAITAQSVGSLPDPVCREVIVIKDYADAVLHALAGSARGLERPINLLQRVVVD